MQVQGRKFLENDDGAVTVDWVVLSAAIIGLGLVLTQMIGTGTTSVAGGVASTLDGIQAGYGNNSTE